ncbi:MAG: fatty acid CoA ligase family protein [bacterium]|nr:fatty acid CoA ligase family protein [bacterium]
MSRGEFANIAAHLPKMALLQPHTPALFFPRKGKYQAYSFSQLNEESDHIAIALESIGIKRGVRTALMVKPGLEFFAITFALFKIGAVPVLIDPGMGLKNLKICLAEAAPEAFIGIPKAHLARIALGWGKESIKILLTVGRRLCWGGRTLARITSAIPGKATYAAAETGVDDTAAILFTSGSTGVPKGAVYSHGNFSAQVEMLRSLYNITPGEIDLPTFPLFALFAPALGMTSVIPEMDFTRPADVDPLMIIDLIRKFKVTSMFGSPALINRVGRYGEKQKVKLPTLKRVISAGAPVPSSVLKRFSSMLEGDAQIFTPYGATEALPVCSIGSREVLAETGALTDAGKGVCVGRPVEGIDLEIIEISDGPIDTWHDGLKLSRGGIGEIVVKGPQVTGSYYNRAGSTGLAKIADPDGGGFYHRMGDLGYRDDKGRIWFCGRKSHRLIAAKGDLFTIPVEAIFNTHEKVFRTALVGIGDPGDMRPVLCVELEKGVSPSEQERIQAELVEISKKHEITGHINAILFHPAFPVDIRHNAKIFREKLAPWAKEQLK